MLYVILVILYMSFEQTRVTSKFQATVPKKTRALLGVKPGEHITWHTLRGIVIVDMHRPQKNPVAFLTSQIKLKNDAVKLVRSVRAEIS